MSGTEYQKIPGPFKRDPQTNRIERGAWTSPALSALASSDDWFFTEKVDGTNVRILWDGHNVSYAGRTDSATFSSEQDLALQVLFFGEDKETLFEQKFGETPVVLYGELYGPKIQSGGVYRDDITFVLFDVRIGGFWLHRHDVEDVAIELGIDIVPIVLGDYNVGTADLWDGINLVTEGFRSTVAIAGKPAHFAEGIVGTTYAGLLDRRGQRVIVKLKHRDLYMPVADKMLG